VRTFYIHPSEFGVAKATADALKGGDAQQNAAIARGVLGGEKGPARNIVVLNAGVSLFIAEAASSIDEGIRRAAESLDSGRAAAALERLVQASHG
jgi:anthranilate phosphoribosyltransferase